MKDQLGDGIVDCDSKGRGNLIPGLTDRALLCKWKSVGVESSLNKSQMSMARSREWRGELTDTDPREESEIN